MTKTMSISAKGTLILAAAAIGARQDRRLSPGETATVPYAYGEHLVTDKFAVEAEPEKASIADVRAARAAVQAAKKKLKAAAEDADAKAAAEQELAASEATLAELMA